MPRKDQSSSYRRNRDDANGATGGNRRPQMTDEEKERKRREMMEDAAQRDKDRHRNIRKYEENDKKELEKESGKFNHDFAR